MIRSHLPNPAYPGAEDGSESGTFINGIDGDFCPILIRGVVVERGVHCTLPAKEVGARAGANELTNAIVRLRFVLG